MRHFNEEDARKVLVALRQSFPDDVPMASVSLITTLVSEHAETVMTLQVSGRPPFLEAHVVLDGKGFYLVGHGEHPRLTTQEESRETNDYSKDPGWFDD